MMLPLAARRAHGRAHNPEGPGLNPAPLSTKPAHSAAFSVLGLGSRRQAVYQSSTNLVARRIWGTRTRTAGTTIFSRGTPPPNRLRIPANRGDFAVRPSASRERAKCRNLRIHAPTKAVRSARAPKPVAL